MAKSKDMKKQSSVKKVAVFDIDGTIFRSSLLIELVEQLISDGVFKKSVRREYIDAHRKWLDRKDSYEKYIVAMVRVFDESIRGVKEKELLVAVEKVIERHHDRVYRYTRDLVKELKKKGYFLLAISHSPKYIADGFAKNMGFDKVYGRFLELDEKGKFTGKGLYLDIITDKSKTLLRAVEKEGLTLRGSVGIGDTESDINFLKLVEHPICFNPNQALYRHAKEEGWQVVVERKDVIYEL